MRKQAVVWKESIYKNGFRCSCGAILAEEDGQHFEDNVLINPSGFRTYVYCRKCLKPVAYLRYINMSEDTDGLQGNINDYERRMKN